MAPRKTTVEEALDAAFHQEAQRCGLEHHDAWVTLINQSEEAPQAMWDHFGDLSDNEMLGMPCRDALVKCRSALSAIKQAKEGR